MIDGFQLDRELSNKRNTVYHNPSDGRVIVAFRGTQFSDPKDLFEDARIAFGTFSGSSRVKKGKHIVKSAAEKYGTDVENVELTGHSLGGRIAQAVGSRLGNKRITAINPGSSPADLLLPTAGSGVGKTYTTGTDPISLSNTLRNPGNVRFRPQQSLEPHGLANFLQ